VKGNVEPVRLVRLPLYESAVGTVRAVHETTIGSKLLASVTEANLMAGQKVRTGDVLVRLDDTDLKAKVVIHELAHALGYDHSEGGVMDESLPLGARRGWDNEWLLVGETDFNAVLEEPALSPTEVGDYFGAT